MVIEVVTKSVKTIARNKKAYHDYFVIESYECGIVLVGTEVKSIRLGRVNLKESYALVRNGEVFVEGMHISPYEQGNRFNHEPLRPKKLLLNKREIRKINNDVQRQGLTLIPLKIYLKRGKMKMELGLCKGKRSYDKRAALARRDAQRDVERAFASIQKWH